MPESGFGASAMPLRTVIRCACSLLSRVCSRTMASLSISFDGDTSRRLHACNQHTPQSYTPLC